MGVGTVSGTGDPVAAGIGVAVRVGRLVAEGLGSAVAVAKGVVVAGRAVEEAGTTVGVALSVAEGVNGSGVVVAPGSACVSGVKNNKNKKNKNRMIATINLKRSYNGARAEVLMLSVFSRWRRRVSQIPGLAPGSCFSWRRIVYKASLKFSPCLLV